MAYQIGIDVSSYEPVLKAAELKGNVGWIAAKACEVDDLYRNGWNANQSVDMWVDPTFANHCQAAYDAGVPFCAYIFDNPAYKMDWYASGYNDHVRNPNDRDPQILALRQALKNKVYHAICIDVERWWKFYNQYYTDKSTAEHIPTLWIRNSAEDLYNRIKEEQAAGRLRNVPIWFYTGKWFVDAYSPELDTFLANKIQWLTYYTGPVYNGTNGATSWNTVKQLVNANTYSPPWVGNRKADIIQVTDRLIAPGIYNATNAPAACDLDIALVDLAALFASGEWSGTTPPVDPPIVVPPVVPPVDLAPLIARIAALESANSANVTRLDNLTAWAKRDNSLK